MPLIAPEMGGDVLETNRHQRHCRYQGRATATTIENRGLELRHTGSLWGILVGLHRRSSIAFLRGVGRRRIAHDCFPVEDARGEGVGVNSRLLSKKEAPMTLISAVSQVQCPPKSCTVGTVGR